MDRHEYLEEIKKVRNHKNFRGLVFTDIFLEFGWSIAKFKSRSWITERVKFWLYAYDNTHKWSNADFLYDITDKAYEKAKANRRARATAPKEKPPRVNQGPVEPDNSWGECSGSLERYLAKSGFSSLREAVFPNGLPKRKR